MQKPALFRQQILLCSFLSLTTFSSLADTNISSEQDIGWFTTLPRVLLDAGIQHSDSSSHGLFAGDVLLPLWNGGDALFYSNIVGKAGHDQSRLGSLGFGYRSITGNSSIWGMYLFGDRNSTIAGNNFSIVNPGLEWLGLDWDFHLNGYVPLGTKKSLVTKNLNGMNNYYEKVLQFTGHKEFYTPVNYMEAVGLGGDTEIGYTLHNLNNTRIYGGVYYYTPEDVGEIHGAQLGIEVPVTPLISVTFTDSYDNVNHNTGMLGLRLQLGGMPQSQKEYIEDHLWDEIPRHLGSLSSGSGIPSKQGWIESDSVFIRDNIWFFTPGNSTVMASQAVTAITEESCTFEHPCAGDQFKQTTVDEIDELSPNAYFYLSAGKYSLENNQLTIRGGQSIYGWAEGFKAPGSFGDDPVLSGTLSLMEGNNTLKNITLDGTGTNQIVGVDIGAVTAGNSINIDHVEIRNYSGNSSNRKAFGIFADYVVNLNIHNSWIHNINGFSDYDGFGSDGGPAYGINIVSHSSGTINVDNNLIQNINGGNSEVQNGGNAYGLFIDASANNVNINITNNTIESLLGGKDNNLVTDMGGDAYGIFANISSGQTKTINANINNNIINGITGGAAGVKGGNAFGMIWHDSSSTIGNYNFTNNTITRITGGNAGFISRSDDRPIGGNATGMSISIDENFQTITINGNHISAIKGGNASVNNLPIGGSAYGILMDRSRNGTVNITNNIIEDILGGNASSFSSQGGSAYGVLIDENRNDNLNISNNIIKNILGGNASGSPSQGGSAYGIFVDDDHNLTLSQNTISNVQAGSGNVAGEKCKTRIHGVCTN